MKKLKQIGDWVVEVALNAVALWVERWVNRKIRKKNK
jgi:hypothetical protein